MMLFLIVGYVVGTLVYTASVIATYVWQYNVIGAIPIRKSRIVLSFLLCPLWPIWAPIIQWLQLLNAKKTIEMFYTLDDDDDES